MKLSALLEVLNIKSKKLSCNAELYEINGICHNSKFALPDCIFVCRKGAMFDGHKYAEDAYNNGTRVFVSEKELMLPNDASVIIVDNTKDALAELSCKFYSYPAKKIKTVGITGTKGKTICAYSSYLILNMCGIKAGYIGTNGIYFSDIHIKSSNTTPDVLELQKTLRLMVDAGISVCIMEVSSQALWQERVKGIEFDICVLTNLYRDHIGGYEHPTFEHYRDSKKTLFSNYGAKHIIINSDQETSDYMIKDACCNDIISVSSMENKNASLYASDISIKTENGLPGVEYKCHISENNNFKIKNIEQDMFVPFPGRFSVENSLEITAICLILGINISDISMYTKKLTVPGRFEYIRLRSRPNSLFIIDYAHNGISLMSAVKALRDYSPKKIICVFGSVGGRTYERRAELGRAASELCDISVITSDNPNFEPPENICNEIEKEFIGQNNEHYVITDRREAILKAYLSAGNGDYVLLAGKGHEEYQLIKGEKLHFSEREILLEIDRLAEKLNENEIKTIFQNQ